MGRLENEIEKGGVIDDENSLFKTSHRIIACEIELFARKKVLARNLSAQIIAQPPASFHFPREGMGDLQISVKRRGSIAKLLIIAFFIFVGDAARIRVDFRRESDPLAFAFGAKLVAEHELIDVGRRFEDRLSVEFDPVVRLFEIVADDKLMHHGLRIRQGNPVAPVDLPAHAVLRFFLPI